ncbi:uncharacterized protein LOC113278996 [Papaver somniferum]|uniref:uncharacterized protein LOC113278996 n=1 Tax=Papaver somniferum TaxID=3469 RepID=UPI000E6F84DE|nr:uncharacterized protein LOC113278996 [Papaver somniferum]
MKKNSEVCLPTDDTTKNGRSNWKCILKSSSFLEEHVECKLNNGIAIRFWYDNWDSSGPLKNKYPAIFKVCSKKNVSVVEMIENGRLACKFRRRLYQHEQLEWNMLCNELGHVHGLHDEDDVVEILDGFSVKKCYEQLVQDDTSWEITKFLWKPQIPAKVSFMLWAMFHNSLPTFSMLRYRGVEVESTTCLFCKREEESADNLFVNCSFA